MEQLAHKQSAVTIGVRSWRKVALAALVAMAAVAVVLILTLPGSDNGTSGSKSATPAVQSQALPPSARFDGGPNEGSRGVISRPNAGQRFDGGPNEGTRGHRTYVIPAPSTTRFDGGADEGTRGPGH